MAWLFATPAVLPVVVGFVGNLDGRHVVSIAEGRESTVVVLHHEGGMPGAEHRHTVLSKVLVAFSQSDRETMDHLLVFPRSEAGVSEDPVAQRDAAGGGGVPELMEWRGCDAFPWPRETDICERRMFPRFAEWVAGRPAVLVLRI